MSHLRSNPVFQRFRRNVRFSFQSDQTADIAQGWIDAMCGHIWQKGLLFLVSTNGAASAEDQPTAAC